VRNHLQLLFPYIDYGISVKNEDKNYIKQYEDKSYNNLKLEEGNIIPNLSIHLIETDKTINFREFFYENDYINDKNKDSKFFNIVNLNNISLESYYKNIKSMKIFGMSYKTFPMVSIMIFNSNNNDKDISENIIGNSIYIMLNEYAELFNNVEFLVIRPDHIIEKIIYKK